MIKPRLVSFFDFESLTCPILLLIFKSFFFFLNEELANGHIKLSSFWSFLIHVAESESHSFASNSLWPHRLYSALNSPGQNTGVGSLSLLRGSSQPRDWTQVSWIAGRFFTSWATREAQELQWVAYPFSSGSSWVRNQTRVSCIEGRFFTNWATREAPKVAQLCPTLCDPMDYTVHGILQARIL